MRSTALPPSTFVVACPDPSVSFFEGVLSDTSRFSNSNQPGQVCYGNIFTEFKLRGHNKTIKI